jgi:hypothetical protein
MGSDSGEALKELIRWETPLDELIIAANRCDERQGPPVTLDASGVRDVLDRCIANDLSISELPRWAGAVHMMDRIEIDDADLDALTQILFEMSSPELFEPITVSACRTWIERLT